MNDTSPSLLGFDHAGDRIGILPSEEPFPGRKLRLPKPRAFPGWSHGSGKTEEWARRRRDFSIPRFPPQSTAKIPLLGSPSPALFTAMTRNSNRLPLGCPDTVVSNPMAIPASTQVSESPSRRCTL
uniref:Uncharacterized protein n=1 Tax=Candidatus Kentrum sp. LFY TaxID=2126342 RepID=A0A450UQA0_9GAMM|nr:MAG: hypothetical protein BECKLFY1418B_GA0070995_10622 [Candidatus Kentron sp. LFY]